MVAEWQLISADPCMTEQPYLGTTLLTPKQKQRYATFLSAYAPTLLSKNEAKDHFYEELDKALQRIPLRVSC